jgi:hypothetical protein
VNTSRPEYHNSPDGRPVANQTDHRPLNLIPAMFYGVPSDTLKGDAEIMEHMVQTCRDALPPASLSLLETYRDMARSEIAWRHDRLVRLDDDPLFMDALHDRALALQTALSIHEYIASEWPNFILERRGRCFRSRCPFIDCRDEHRSFTIFDGDFAWCTTCERGGHIFRVIALCEGLDAPFAQIRRAAELVGNVETAPAPASIPHEHRSFTTDSLRACANRERSGTTRTWGT